MHVMNVFCMASQFVTPIIVRGFLVDVGDVMHRGGGGDSCHNTTGNISVYASHGTDTAQGNSSVLSMNNSGESPTYDSGDSDIIEAVSYARFAYVAVGAFPVAAAMCSFVNFFIFKDYKKICLTPLKKKSTYDDVQEHKPDMVILVLFSMLMFLYNFLLSTPASFFASFAVKGLCLNVKTGSDLTTAYFFSNMAGKLLTVLMSNWLRPIKLLYILLSCNAFSWTLGLFIPLTPELVWVTAAVAGLGMSSLHFNILLWLADFVTITGRISSLCLISSYSAALVGPCVNWPPVPDLWLHVGDIRTVCGHDDADYHIHHHGNSCKNEGFEGKV